MKINCKSYMTSAEFVLRQAVFEFAEGCRESMMWLQNRHDDWVKAWHKVWRTEYRKPAGFQEQLNLGFMRKIAEWANWTPEKNQELFIHKIGG